MKMLSAASTIRSRLPRIAVAVLLVAATQVAQAGVPASAAIPVVTTIPVGDSPSRAVRHGGEIYVSNAGSNTVSVIDIASNSVTATLSVGSTPDSLAAHGGRVYVGNHGGSVSVIDTTTKAVTTIAAGGPVRDVAVTPDGQWVYLALEGAGLKRLATATNTVSMVSSFVCPEGVAVTPDGTRLWVNYQCGGPGGTGGHDAIGIFDASSGAYLRSVTGLANVGTSITIGPDGTQAWANGGNACDPRFYDTVGCPFVPSGILNVVDVASGSLSRAIGFAGFAPSFTTVFPDSSRAAVGSAGELLIFDTTTFAITETLPIAASGSLAFTADGARAYAPIPSADAVAVLGFAPPAAIALTPATATNDIGTSHTLTATVTSDTPAPGTPIAGTTVTFTVVAGPHTGTTGIATTNSAGVATFSYTGTAVGTDTIEATFIDALGRTQRSNRVEKTWVAAEICGNGRDDDGDGLVDEGCNKPPVCSAAAASPGLIWPPNHKMVPVRITGLTDPDGDSLTVTITSIRQDEPTNTVGDGTTEVDGSGVGTSTAMVRAERSGTPKVPGNGRAYHIGFTASDGKGGTCTGNIRVGVPHDQGGRSVPVDGGPLYDSTTP